MKSRRFPLLSVRGILLRACLLLPIHFVLLWWLHGQNLIAAVLAPSSAVTLATSLTAVVFLLVRAVTVLVLPGVILACCALLLLDRFAARTQPK